MRSTSLAARCLALLLVVLGAVGIAAAPAAALSCAPHPDGSPRAIASGTERLATRDEFFEHYDFAVLGTVTRVSTVETPGSPEYGHTTIEVDVAGVLGHGAPSRRIVLTAADPGWLAGYGFEEGRRYFVPVTALGPDRRPNHSFVCDPITEVRDLDGLVDDVAASAASAGIPFATPTGEAAPTTHGTPGDTTAGASSPAVTRSSSPARDVAAWTVAGVVVVATATAVAAGVRHRRRRDAPR
jgi:hypothetical protein